MKAILMSIHPKWAEKIFNGEKTIEVRKTVPKLETPFKVYLYETKTTDIEHYDGCDIKYYGRGKVIGSFVCDRIDEYAYATIACAKFEVNGAEVAEHKRYNAGACLTAEEMFEYSNGKFLYGWHITETKLFEKPRKLSEFRTPFACETGKEIGCWNDYCKNHNFDCVRRVNKRITRPPQSWCYVEEEK